MKSTIDIILVVTPVILNGALIWVLILQRREQIRYEKQWKAHMEGIQRALDVLKNTPDQDSPSCNGGCGMNYCDENGCVERKRYLTDLPLKHSLITTANSKTYSLP